MFKDSDDSESESEGRRSRQHLTRALHGVRTIGQAAHRMTDKPLQKPRQLLLPKPAECNQGYPLRVSPSSCQTPLGKKIRLLRRLQQFTMDSLGALIILQGQLSEKPHLTPGMLEQW